MNKLIIVFLLALLPSVLWSDSAKIIIHSQEHLTIVNDVMLQRIFTLKETRWPDGTPIKVFVRPTTSTEHRDFVTNVLNMSTYAYNKALDMKMYTPSENTITTVRSREQMISAITKNRGSIGYVDNVVVRNGSKVLVVDDVFNN